MSEISDSTTGESLMAAHVRLSAQEELMLRMNDKKLVFQVAVFGAGIVSGLVLAAALQYFF